MPLIVLTYMDVIYVVIAQSSEEEMELYLREVAIQALT